MEKKYIAYYRVSTKEQGKSGLGLEAQKLSVENFVSDKGIILQEFVEIESGKKNARLQLANALEAAKKQEAILIVAKLDRLSRNASFLMALKDSKLKFVCVDNPNLTTFTLGIYATIAQDEAEKISLRTKEALQIKKKQGFKLGTPENLTDLSRDKSKASKKENALVLNKNAFECASDLRKQGLSYHKIAQKLSNYGIKTRHSKHFTACSVRNLFLLYEGS